MAINKNSFEAITSQVLDQGICVVCGACVGHCPYLEYQEGRVAIIERCRVDRGRCELVCPQLDLLHHYQTEPYLQMEPKYIMGRGTNEKLKDSVQYGGVVSSLILYLLDSHRIKKAILTDRGTEGYPKGFLATSPKEVISCGGSRYSASATLSELNRLMSTGPLENLAVVGLPCQMRAVSLMERNQLIPEGSVYKIGLFCTWAIDLRRMKAILNEEGIDEPPIRFDIPPPPANTFLVYGKDKKWQIPLDKMRGAVLKGCMYCPDMIAYHSDISVGAAEGIQGFNTICIWTEKGAYLIEEARKAGLIEIEALPQKNELHLKESALNKRNRAIARHKERNTHEVVQ